ncbi:MAG: glycosyltransferase, partial [Patescibacteria group bacterium]
MRIAIVTTPLITSGGTERQVLELAVQLQKNGHSVDVFAPEVDFSVCYPQLISEVNVKSLRGFRASRELENSDSALVKIRKVLHHLLFRPFLNQKFVEFIRRHHEENPYDVFNYHHTAVEYVHG